MLLQVGGSISFAPEGEGKRQVAGIATRHMLAELPRSRSGDDVIKHDR